MTRTKLETFYYKIGLRKIENFIQSKEIFVSLLGKIKKKYYENLNEKFVVNNKLFWKI